MQKKAVSQIEGGKRHSKMVFEFVTTSTSAFLRRLHMFVKELTLIKYDGRIIIFTKNPQNN